ncbi:MAG: FG-GAP repeat protein, partial [Thermoleophilaceae bacterium]
MAEGRFVGFPPSGVRDVDSGLAEVGDVNGDGIADVAIGAASADPRGRRDAGLVRVLLGGPPLGRIDVRSSGWAGAAGWWGLSHRWPGSGVRGGLCARRARRCQRRWSPGRRLEHVGRRLCGA